MKDQKFKYAIHNSITEFEYDNLIVQKI